MKNCKPEADRLDPAGICPDRPRRTGRPEPPSARCAAPARSARRPPRSAADAGTQAGDKERLHGLPRGSRTRSSAPATTRSLATRARPMPNRSCRQGQGRRAGRLGRDPDAAQRSEGRGHPTLVKWILSVPSNPNFYRGEVMNNQRRNVLKAGSGAALMACWPPPASSPRAWPGRLEQDRLRRQEHGRHAQGLGAPAAGRQQGRSGHRSGHRRKRRRGAGGRGVRCPT
jgi:hypothetical protein